MKTKFFGFIAASFLIVISVVLINKIFAQEATGLDSVKYPIEALGNCADKAACASYCDKPENVQACLNFAEKNNLMSKEDLDTAKKFTEIGDNAPGGCKTKDTCEAYCNDISRIDECISFAEKNNLMPPQELEEAKKVQKAIANGIKPPPCANKKACDTYCENPDNMEECINFGEAAGFLQGKELEDSKKMLVAVKKGVKPPPCKGKQACDAYCSDPQNIEVCVNFAIEAGLMSEQEKAESQKMVEAVKKGIKPPNCKGKEECDTYCSQDEHFEECANFAEAAGFMSAEDAAMARKTKGKGPGDCKGKEECEAFCNNPDNQETCFNFAKDNGLISEADLKQMEEGARQMKEALNQAPAAVVDCLGSDLVEGLKNGTTQPSKDLGDKMQECFQKMGPPQQGEPGANENNGMPPFGGQTGPGGCQTPEECQSYCQNNPQECQNFTPPTPNGEGGQFGNPPPGEAGREGFAPPSGQTGPGGCQTPEECQSYCQNNPQECQGGPASAPSNGEGGQYGSPENRPNIPDGNFQGTGPNGCQTPEECQNFQPPSSPTGEPYNNNGEPSNYINNNNQEYPRTDQIPPTNSIPPQGENYQYGPPPGAPTDQQQQPPSSQFPTQQQPPMENYGPVPPQSQTPPDGQQYQYPPIDQQQPPTESFTPPPTAPTGEQPPAENPPPPPTSYDSSSKSESILGSLFNVIAKLFRLRK